MDSEDTSEVLRRTAGELGGRVDEAFSAVEALRERVSTLPDDAGPLTRASLTVLRPLIHRLLAKEHLLLEGLGVAVGEGALADASRWLEWWRREAPGGTRFVKHALDPGALGFYDYQARPWFRTPARTGEEVAVGPYFDSGGIDVYTVTLTAPLELGTGGSVVVGGDLDVVALEAAFLRSVGRLTPAVALLGDNDRVVVSNTARFVPGDRMDPYALRGVTAERPVASREPGRLSWRLVALAG